MVVVCKIMAASRSSAAIFISAITLAFASGHAHALVSDDEARRAIIDLRARVEAMGSKLVELEARLQASAQGQLQILNENERLRAEIAHLRGQLEEASQMANTGKSQQKDFYVDLDQRLKQIEPVSISVDGVNVRVSPAEKTKFEDLRELLRVGEFKKSAAAAEAFRQAFPASPLSATVLFLRGSALYADKDYMAAIAARQEFIDRYPNHPSRPQAILNLAANQAESGNPNTARGILESLIKNYPNSAAATEAKERLKTLRPAAPTRAAPAKATPSK